MTTSAGRSSGRGLGVAHLPVPSRVSPAVAILWLGTILLSCLVVAGCQPAGGGRAAEVHSFSGSTMGTSYSVRYVDAADEPDSQLQARVEKRLAEINRMMSTYDAESELSKFNQHEGDDWFSVSEETAHVVAYALKVAEDSGGAFDPTVGPIVNLWGFGPSRRREQPPSEVEIGEAISSVGHEKLSVRQEPPALRKSNAGLYVDLSAIAKGYGVDEISDLLADLGYLNSMVEIGGEVRTRGSKPGEEPWRIGVEKPDSGGRNLQKIYPLRDGAMATSGDYRNFFEYEGVRYSHTIDPITGQPVQHQTATVTVLAETCIEADALATGLLVMGDGKGYDWCIEHDIAALFLAREEDGVVERATPRFDRMTNENEIGSRSEP